MMDKASNRPLIVFRTDASLEIGTGHVMRCLTLADALREGGARTLFITRENRGHLVGQIVDGGHEVRVLPQSSKLRTTASDIPAHAQWLGVEWGEDAQQTRQLLADERPAWLVVDHYAIERRWEQALRSTCERLLVMDDLADRPHDCDLLLDPTLGRTRGDYAEHLAADVRTLLGPKYALLRPQFAAYRNESLARRKEPELRHILIAMGGVDKDNATGRVLDAIQASDLPSQLKLTVVMGPQAPWLSSIQDRASRMRVSTDVRVGVTDMARLMVHSDLAIGAAGGTSWERCCMGLPTLILSLAENQKKMTQTLQDAGAAIAFNSITELVNHIEMLFTERECLIDLAQLISAAAQVADGLGSQRVCSEMMG